MAEFEEVRAMLSVTDHRIVRACDDSRLAERVGERSTSSLMAKVLRIAPGEARARVKAAELLAPRPSPLGPELPPVREHVAAAQSVGQVTTRQAAMINESLQGIETACPLSPGESAALEETMVGHARQFGPRELQACLHRMESHLNPDGVLPPEAVIHDRRFLHLVQRRDGSYVIEGSLTRACGAQLWSVLSSLAKPRPSDVTGPDLRSPGQRMHDALDDVAGRLLRSGRLPHSGGTPATVIVTIDHAALVRGTGFGTTTDGQPLPVDELLRLASEADVIPVVLDRAGAVLSSGRASRVATPAQATALYARDGGCSFPGCEIPPEWCEKHHVVEWIKGGFTDLDNLTLVCKYHHRNFQAAGWTCLMINNLPHWRPPDWLPGSNDPVLHHRIAHRSELYEQAA
ncbi:MAG: HNH endonuclease [Propionibacteriales bacterium]|nr:HNH endonuclease [Propionibacteriales bacterium]